MSKMTFKFTSSFDTTVIVDVEALTEQLDLLKRASEAEGFEKLPAKNQAFTKLVLQARERSEEEGIAEFLRFNLRTQLNEMLAAELNAKDKEITVKSSPAKVVIDGLQVTA